VRTSSPPPSLPPSLPRSLSVSLLVSNDVLEYEISLLNSQNPERLDESEKTIRDAELNMKLNLLVPREGGREGGRKGGREGGREGGRGQ